MKVAAIYDIHANLPALEAVLADIRAEQVQQLLVGGDVFPGPMPRESLECLLNLSLPVQFISGNGDRAVLAEMQGRETDPLPETAREVVQWVARQLNSKDEQALSSWPQTACIHISGVGKVLFCHATPRSDTEIFTRLTPEERLLPVFEEVSVPLVICGHTHMQFDRMIGKTRVINAGSVGMPFDEPGAYWLLLGPQIELRRTPYDVVKAAERIRATEYPQADQFAVQNVLNPPSEAAMLEAYARVELR